MPSITLILFAALGLLHSSYAQTWTSCSPLNSTCPDDTALGNNNYTIDFTTDTPSTKVWNPVAGNLDFSGQFKTGAAFTIANKLDSPTIQSAFYFFFGQLEVIMRAAPGQGVVSSIVCQSDVLDEIDWEIIGSNTTSVQSNYFGKGNQTAYGNGGHHQVDSTLDFHNYTLDWSADKLDWIIDGNVVRTLKYEDAEGGHTFPQTPMYVKLGIWPAGDPKNPNGTVQWAGGPIDYKAGPYAMDIKSVRVSDASNATSYHYGDNTGDWKSVQLLQNKPALKLDGANAPPTLSSATKTWNGLSTGAKIGILSGVGGVLLLLLALFAFFCIKQRRLGKKEKALEDATWEKNTQELLGFRAEMHRQRTQRLQEMVGQNGTGSGGFGGQRGYQRF